MAKKEQKPDAPGEEGPKAPLFDVGKLSMPVAAGTLPAGRVLVEKMSLGELLDLRARIDEHLPARSLADLDLEEEVLLQFARVKQLLADISEDEDVPANQRAQVANSCTTILDQLIRMQAKLYGAERMKMLEQCLIKVLKVHLSEIAQKDFFDRYERALEEIDLQGVVKK